ncbi:tyrosine--tRNA ligase [Enterobacteriaceae endosymbiont of Macroplea appendiculata]|uniref:tyrosine--tRNA ligase n=1 Tax=Enterobacteriaceae endosymbiont of Macroplea appendiculata TaxID=2675790 RepID=UPI00144954B1|nr:tyrosine--tRNA ligase [Enterobacteriaceae endosymbiont of Macroplea appendiculata]QJC30736.1 tyrosine--tRNA ligase [Enterobacteriaceae endosymbiont of Macroplea appendiculata]
MLNNNQIDILHQLKSREILYQITDMSNLHKLLSNNKINLYCGFDLTADSLHIGHLITIITLKYFQKLGHNIIILLGGATSLIGDPSFKHKQRSIINMDIINKWYTNISIQLQYFFQETNITIVNNFDWFNSMNVLFFLKNIGQNFYVNQMINKDAIKNRFIKNKEHNHISYTEFSYNLLQAYDFAFLYKNNNVMLQIGGSDQWGNIVSGIELIKKLYQYKVYGLTTHLITKKNGVKFGKTENQTIWLDKNKTTPYLFFQYWLNISDSIVFKLLKMFTKIDSRIINEMKHKKTYYNKQKSAQYILAEYMTNLVHGKTELLIVQKITYLLFVKQFSRLIENDFYFLLKNNINNIFLNQKKYSLQDILVCSHLAPSKKQAKNMIQAHAIHINDQIITDINFICNIQCSKFNHFSLLRKGKKNFVLIFWQ